MSQSDDWGCTVIFAGGAKRPPNDQTDAAECTCADLLEEINCVAIRAILGF